MKKQEGIPSAGVPTEVRIRQDLASAILLQQLLADISSIFVSGTEVQTEDIVVDALRLICETLGLDRASLWHTVEAGSGLALSHFWQRPGCVPMRRNFVTSGNLPWAESLVNRGESFHFSSLLDPPPEAALDMETLRTHGTKSNATFPLFGSGKVFGALAFATVVNERRWTDSEISGLKLIAQVFGQAISRRQAQEHAEQLREEIQRFSRASVLGELAAGLAHEINQPLTAILSNAQAARRFIDHGEAKPEEIRSILDDIIRDNKRADAVVRNLREMLAGSRARRESRDLNELITEVAGFLRTDLESEGIELRLKLAPILPRLLVVRVEIQQVFVNLIGNAIHSMKVPSVRLRRIDIQTRKSANRVSVRVRDHGSGIPHEHLDRIFDPFHSTRPDGLGIGLAICRRIVEAHGGAIQAANRKAGGAEFSFSLPISS